MQLHPLAQMTTQTPTPTCWAWQLLLWGGREWTQNWKRFLQHFCGVGASANVLPSLETQSRVIIPLCNMVIPTVGHEEHRGPPRGSFPAGPPWKGGAEDTWLLAELIRGPVPSDLLFELQPPRLRCKCFCCAAKNRRAGKGAATQPAEETEISESR